MSGIAIDFLNKKETVSSCTCHQCDCISHLIDKMAEKEHFLLIFFENTFIWQCSVNVSLSQSWHTDTKSSFQLHKIWTNDCTNPFNVYIWMLQKPWRYTQCRHCRHHDDVINGVASRHVIRNERKWIRTLRRRILKIQSVLILGLTAEHVLTRSRSIVQLGPIDEHAVETRGRSWSI